MLERVWWIALLLVLAISVYSNWTNSIKRVDAINQLTDALSRGDVWVATSGGHTLNLKVSSTADNAHVGVTTLTMEKADNGN